MEVSTIINKIQQCFDILPDNDPRAILGPKTFVVNLIFSFFRDSAKRSLSSLRREIGVSTGKILSRGAFWERLARKKLFEYLKTITEALMKKLSCAFGVGPELLFVLGVKEIFLLDSSSMSLPKGAKEIFPAPRTNVAPAAIKWHLFINLLSGAMNWFSLSKGTRHDRMEFPPISKLVGNLIIFDLGYFDFSLLKEIADAGGFFLSRVKENTNIMIEKVVEGLPKSFEGYHLLNLKMPKKKTKIIEVRGNLEVNYKPFLTLRVIGFWNPLGLRYHWYITNLSCPAKLIYPLYRLRWQVELVFKSAKASLRWKDSPSGNENIILALTYVALIGTLITHPISRYLCIEMIYEKSTAISFQRSAFMITHLKKYFVDFILSPVQENLRQLKNKLFLFHRELIDPNYLHRETSLMRAIRVAGGNL